MWNPTQRRPGFHWFSCCAPERSLLEVDSEFSNSEPLFIFQSIWVDQRSFSMRNHCGFHLICHGPRSCDRRHRRVSNIFRSSRGTYRQSARYYCTLMNARARRWALLTPRDAWEMLHPAPLDYSAHHLSCSVTNLEGVAATLSEPPLVSQAMSAITRRRSRQLCNRRKYHCQRRFHPTMIANRRRSTRSTANKKKIFISGTVISKDRELWEQAIPCN